MQINAYRPKERSSFGLIKKIGIVIGIFTLMTLFSCVSHKAHITTTTSNPNEPSWMHNLPTSTQYVYFLGTASYVDSLQEGNKIARKDAYSMISDYLGISISSEYNSRTSNHGSTAELMLKSSSSAIINNAELVETYFVKKTRREKHSTIEKFDVFALYKYSKATAKSEQTRQASDKRKKINRAFKLYNSAISASNRFDYQSSIIHLKKAISVLNEMGSFSSANIPLDSVQLKLKCDDKAREISNKLHSLSISFKINEQMFLKESYLSNLTSALNANGFRITNNTPYFKIVSSVKASYSGVTMNNHVFKISGHIQAFDSQKKLIIASSPIEVKGFATDKIESKKKAFEEAGLESGKDIALKLKELSLLRLTIGQ